MAAIAPTNAENEVNKGVIVKRCWPWVLTAVALLAGITVFFKTPDMNTRSQIGDYLSGFAGAIAFIWLIAAYLQQGRELNLQRRELSLQRASLDLQREELRRLGKYAALEQASRILAQFDLGLQKNPDAPVRSANDLPMAFMNGMKIWKILLESKNPNEVFDAHLRWMKIYGPCAEFLERVVSAIDIYSEATGQVVLVPVGSSAERIYYSFEQIKDIPHVRHYIGAAYSLASSMVAMEPGLDEIQLSGLEAASKLMPRVIKAEAITALRAKVAAHEATRQKANAMKQTQDS
jgi:hypothetical protein